VIADRVVLMERWTTADRYAQEIYRNPHPLLGALLGMDNRVSCEVVGSGYTTVHSSIGDYPVHSILLVR